MVSAKSSSTDSSILVRTLLRSKDSKTPGTLSMSKSNPINSVTKVSSVCATTFPSATSMAIAPRIFTSSTVATTSARPGMQETLNRVSTSVRNCLMVDANRITPDSGTIDMSVSSYTKLSMSNVAPKHDPPMSNGSAATTASGRESESNTPSIN